MPSRSERGKSAETGFQVTRPYSAIAGGYDIIMAHVPYREWASHIHRTIQRFHPRARTILELGCGTGSLALELQPMGRYRYSGSDASNDMVEMARKKTEAANLPIRFETADFTNFRIGRPVDVVLLLYDGLNYLLEDAEVGALLKCISQALKPGGLLIFDVSTPANSLNNAPYFDDEDEAGGFSFVRRSAYDPENRLHSTDFRITLNGERFVEHHVQRAYELPDVKRWIDGTDFGAIGFFDDFTLEDATPASERFHCVVRKLNGKA